jgi:hypothetical protein
MRMSKMNIDSLQEKYETALAEKGNNFHNVEAAIIENDLNSKYEYLRKEKEKVNSSSDLEKYRNTLEKYFDEVYEIITAPGVNSFVEWLESLELKGIDVNARNRIAKILIDKYSDYDEALKSILENKSYIENSNSLFENIKKSIRINILKRLSEISSSKDDVNEELPDFIEELDTLLRAISELEELRYTEVRDFYTTNLSERDNLGYTPEIDVETDYYFEIIKQVVQRKDFLTTDKDKIQISTIVENIEPLFSDLYNSIEILKTIGISPESEDIIKVLYNKFEVSVKLNSIDNISEHLAESVDEMWHKIIDAVDSCQNFYSTYTSEKLDKLEINRKLWKQFSFSNEIEQYVLTIKNIISRNPIASLGDNNISQIKTNITKIEKAIKSLEENNPKDGIVSFFTQVVDDYEDKKIGILEKLQINPEQIELMREDINIIKSYLETISNTPNLLDAINEELSDGIIGIYKTVKDQFTSVIEQSDLEKNDLDYLYDIPDEQLSLTKVAMENDFDRFVRLLEKGLININITKNI